MGRRGPKPKTKARMEMDGDPGRRKARYEGQIEPPPARPTNPAPAFLGKHGKGKWVELVPLLIATDHFTSIDGDAFSIYCKAWDDFHACEAVIAKEGMFITSEKGGVYAHPALVQRGVAEKKIERIGGLFGMNPTGRVGLKSEGGGGGTGPDLVTFAG